jgi:hypothetical protein
MPPHEEIYHAQIAAGSLLLMESREIARFLLENSDEPDWHQALVVNNILQKNSPASARRIARLIRNRLEPLSPEVWQLVLDPSREVAIQTLLAASIKHSRLLRDFLDQVVREHYRTFKRQLTLSDWKKFLEESAARDPEVSDWAESTQKKLGQVIIRILAEAGYLDSTRSMKLSPIRVHPRVRKYLLDHNEKELLRSMEIDK